MKFNYALPYNASYLTDSYVRYDRSISPGVEVDGDDEPNPDYQGITTHPLSLSFLSFISFRHFSFFHPKIRFFPSVSHLRSFLHLFRDHRSSFFFREFQILAFNLNGILTRVSSKRSISPRNHPLNSELISRPGWKKRIFLLHILTSLFCCVSRNTAQRTYVRSSSTPLIVPISHPLFYAPG